MLYDSLTLSLLYFLSPLLSLFLSGPGTGVPFHIHGPTFAETIFGRKVCSLKRFVQIRECNKEIPLLYVLHLHASIISRQRWFLYPPDVNPVFDPDVSTLDWLEHTYPHLPADQRPLECVLQPGEVCELIRH